MPSDKKSCHGQFDCLQASSCSRRMASMLKILHKVRSYIVWHLENMGFWGTLEVLLSRITKAFTPHKRKRKTVVEDNDLPEDEHVLNLRPGDLVEVKSAEEILATLDKTRRHKGLHWMTGMRKYCGERYRVYKRLETILLESNGEIRKMKNTVLLEGVMCDGAEFCGCDRSCFHFWREVWLRRVPE